MPNYEALVAELAPKTAAANPYLTLLDRVESQRQLEEQRRVRLLAATSQALDVNPDSYAAGRRAAQSLGLPPAVGEALPDETARRAAQQRIVEDSAASVTLQRKYSDSDFAKLAHDDSSVLSSIAAVARFVFSHPDERNTLMGTIGSGALKASAGAAGAFRSVAEAVAPVLDPLAGRVLPENPLRRVAAGFAANANKGLATARDLNPPVQGIVPSGAISGVESLVQNTFLLPAALLPGGQSIPLLGGSAITAGSAHLETR